MISSLFKKFLKIFWFLPGFLLWAAFPPMGEKMDVVFALAPLIWASRQMDAKASALRWFMSGAMFYVATLSWMPAIVKNGGPWPLVVLGWGILSLYCASYFAAYGYLSAKAWQWARGGGYWRRALCILVAEPVLWCGLELVRSRLGGGFAWNQLGVVAVNSGFGAPAALGGVYLLSGVIILINGTWAGIAERAFRKLESVPRFLRPLETMVPFALVFALFSVSSGFVAPDGAEGRQPLKVAMVQRNFPCVFKTQEADPYEVYKRLAGNFSALKPDLVVLAESAMCEFGPVDGLRAHSFSKWLSDLTGGAVLSGGSRAENGKIFNSAALYRSGAPLQIYDKVHLVPFGEYIPGDKVFKPLQKLAPVGSCTSGDLKLLELDREGGGKLKIGVAICFEDTDSAQMRKLAEMGADMLVLITNDSWFSHSVEAEQHAWQATARAVETGLVLVRVGNSGVTGVVKPSGETSWLQDSDARLLVDRPGTMFDRIFPLSHPTPYVRFGDKPLFVAFVLMLSFLAFWRFGRRIA